MLRVVLDTNVVLASQKSTHPTSPNREVTDRWLSGEFVLLMSDDIAIEYAEKLLGAGRDRDLIESFLANVFLLAEFTEIFEVAIPNATTRKAIEDSEKGINLTSFNSVDKLFESWDK